jgi:hypothetical protein
LVGWFGQIEPGLCWMVVQILVFQKQEKTKNIKKNLKSKKLFHVSSGNLGDRLLVPPYIGVNVSQVWGCGRTFYKM